LEPNRLFRPHVAGRADLPETEFARDSGKGRRGSDSAERVPIDTQTLVREATHLAPLPQAALRLIAVLSREDWTPDEVLEIVELDPVLTGKVLGAANSAVSGGVKKILALDEAVRRIGPRAVAGLAVASGVKGRLSAALPQFGLAEGELWRHSVSALLAAELASVHFKLPYSTAGVTAALLHDVGKVLLARLLDPDTLAFLRLAQVEGGATRWQAETEVLSITHGELGALIAAHWGLPEEICGAVRHHHDPRNAPESLRRDAALVRLADAAAKIVAPPKIKDSEDPSELQAAVRILAVPERRFGDFYDAVRERFQKVGAAY
jgi:HD-like signal output (HDOD) protein